MEKRVYSIGGVPPPVPFSASSTAISAAATTISSSGSNSSSAVTATSAAGATMVVSSNNANTGSPMITSTPTSPAIISTTSSSSPNIIVTSSPFKPSPSSSSPTLVSTNFENNLTGSSTGVISSGAGSTLPQILTPHKLPGNTATYQTSNNGTIIYTVVSSMPSATTTTTSTIPSTSHTQPIPTTPISTSSPSPSNTSTATSTLVTSSTTYRPSYIAGSEAKISPKVKVEDLGPSFMYSQPIQTSAAKPTTTSFQNLEQQIDNMSNTTTNQTTVIINTVPPPPPPQQQQQHHQQQPVNRSTPTIIKQVPINENSNITNNNSNNNNNCKNNLNNQQQQQQQSQYIVLPPDYNPKIKRRKSVENLDNTTNNVNNNFYGYVSYTSSSSTNSKQNSPHSSPNTSPQYFDDYDSSPSSPDGNFKNLNDQQHNNSFQHHHHIQQQQHQQQPMIIDSNVSTTSSTTTTTTTSPTTAPTTPVGFTFPSIKNNSTTTFGVMPNEQETWIEIRDLSSGISKMAKSSLTNGITEEMLTDIKEKGKVLMNMIETVTKKEKLERSLNDDERSRIFPPLTRPRRFRKKKKMALEPAHNGNVEKIKKKADTLFCTSCGTTQTPEWRKGPAGGKSLCNACGLHYAKLMKKEGQLKVETTSSPPSTSMNVVNLLN